MRVVSPLTPHWKKIRTEVKVGRYITHPTQTSLQIEVNVPETKQALDVKIDDEGLRAGFLAGEPVRRVLESAG
jgi:hypothetical protein